MLWEILESGGDGVKRPLSERAAAFVFLKHGRGLWKSVCGLLSCEEACGGGFEGRG
jgi:hypothetical protein